MNGENIPLLAYFFVGVTSLVLAYVTYSDEIHKIPGQVKDSFSTSSSSLSSVTNSLSNPLSSESSSDNTSATTILTTLNPLPTTNDNSSTMTGGKRKHKKTKRHHSKSKHNNTKHNKSKK